MLRCDLCWDGLALCCRPCCGDIKKRKGRRKAASSERASLTQHLVDGVNPSAATPDQTATVDNHTSANGAEKGPNNANASASATSFARGKRTSYGATDASVAAASAQPAESDAPTAAAASIGLQPAVTRPQRMSSSASASSVGASTSAEYPASVWHGVRAATGCHTWAQVGTMIVMRVYTSLSCDLSCRLLTACFGPPTPALLGARGAGAGPWISPPPAATPPYIHTAAMIQ